MEFGSKNLGLPMRYIASLKVQGDLGHVAENP